MNGTANPVTVIVVLVMVSVVLGIISFTGTDDRYIIPEYGGFIPQGSYSWSDVGHIEDAESFTLRLDLVADEDFDIYLFDTAEWDSMIWWLSDIPELRHGVAGSEAVEWTVEASEFGDQGLTLLKDASGKGEVGPSSDAIRFNGEYSTIIHKDLTSNPLFYIFLCTVGALVVATIIILSSRQRPEEGTDYSLTPSPYGTLRDDEY